MPKAIAFLISDGTLNSRTPALVTEADGCDLNAEITDFARQHGLELSEVTVNPVLEPLGNPLSGENYLLDFESYPDQDSALAAAAEADIAAKGGDIDEIRAADRVIDLPPGGFFPGED